MYLQTFQFLLSSFLVRVLFETALLFSIPVYMSLIFYFFSPSLVSETITASNIKAAPTKVLLERTSESIKNAKIGAKSDSVARSIDALVEVVAL